MTTPKVRLNLLCGALICLVACTSLQSGRAEASACTTETASSETIPYQLCITTPVSGSTVSGDVEVTATVTKPRGTPGVEQMIFSLDNAHLLTDYLTPFTFQLPSARFPDGSHTLSVQAVMRGSSASAPLAISLNFDNGVTQPPASTNTFTPTTGTVPPAGQPVVVAVTGDGASGETPGVPSLIASWSPNLFLYLGDVYEDGTYTEMYNWYGHANQWFSQFRNVTDPVIGNHEYIGDSGFGYLDYWDIGHDAPTYYSFDAGGWHFIELNANSEIKQEPGSPEYEWLVQDLNSDTAACTLAYWHEPIFSVGPELPAINMEPIWTLLAQHHVDLVLNGHDHDYQRWKPLDANGDVDLQNGITEFVVGTGGHGIQAFSRADNRVVIGYDKSPTAYGALKLLLNPNGMTFEFVNIAGTVLDSGALACHGPSASATPSATSTDQSP